MCLKTQRQSCKAFTGLSNRAQIVGGDVPLNVSFEHKTIAGPNLTHPPERFLCDSPASCNLTFNLNSSNYNRPTITGEW